MSAEVARLKQCLALLPLSLYLLSLSVYLPFFPLSLATSSLSLSLTHQVGGLSRWLWNVFSPFVSLKAHSPTSLPAFIMTMTMFTVS